MNNFRVISEHSSCPSCNGKVLFKEKASNKYDKYSCEKCDLTAYGLNGVLLSSLANYKLIKMRKLAFYYVKNLVMRKLFLIKSKDQQIQNPSQTLKLVIQDSITWLSKISNVDENLVNINFFDKYLCEQVIDHCKPHYIKPKNANPVFVNNYRNIEIEEISRFFLEYKLTSRADSRYLKKDWFWVDLDKWY